MPAGSPTSEYRSQHYVPCLYLANFAAERRDPLRLSMIWMFNGRVCRPVTLESQCAEDYLYSRLSAAQAERFFQETFEARYQPIADTIIAGQPLAEEEQYSLLMFMLSMYARSPDFEIRSGEERFNTIGSIMGSLVNGIVPILPEDYAQDSDHPRRLLASFGFFTLRLDQQIWTSDNPCIPMMDHARQSLGSLIFMPIDPRTVAFFYRLDHYRYRGSAPTADDIKLLLLLIRNRRLRNLYYPVNVEHLCRRDTDLPRDSYPQQYVSRDKVAFSMLEYGNDFSFLETI